MKNTSTQGSDDDGASRRQEIEHLHMLSRAVDQSPASVVITDNEGNIQYVNPKFIQLTGYTFEEVLGRNPRILKSGDTPSDEYTKMWDLITSGNEWRGEFHNKKKNGELYWEFASISPIRNSQGQITILPSRMSWMPSSMLLRIDPSTPGRSSERRFSGAAIRDSLSRPDRARRYRSRFRRARSGTLLAHTGTRAFSCHPTNPEMGKRATYQ